MSRRRRVSDKHTDSCQQMIIEERGNEGGQSRAACSSHCDQPAEARTRTTSHDAERSMLRQQARGSRVQGTHTPDDEEEEHEALVAHSPASQERLVLAAAPRSRRGGARRRPAPNALRTAFCLGLGHGRWPYRIGHTFFLGSRGHCCCVWWGWASGVLRAARG